ncbi:MAG: response regulator [bacterium]|nr:response regulator [Candidatus Kapabacteria bacterium]
MDRSEKRRILLVEDHPDTALVVRFVLEQRGYDVTTASSCAEARAAKEATSFDLLICDIGLPDGSGLDLMGELCGGGDIPAIAVSGFGTKDDVKRSLSAGFADHLTKPFGMHILLDAVARALKTN